MFHRPGFRVCYLAIFPDVWMKSSQEGKLLAGAAGFYSPWGNESEEQGHRILLSAFFMKKKETLRIVRRSLHPLHSHQGEREKNEYI
jgi:hypothetical protein